MSIKINIAVLLTVIIIIAVILRSYNHQSGYLSGNEDESVKTSSPSTISTLTQDTSYKTKASIETTTSRGKDDSSYSFTSKSTYKTLPENTSQNFSERGTDYRGTSPETIEQTSEKYNYYGSNSTATETEIDSLSTGRFSNIPTFYLDIKGSTNTPSYDESPTSIMTSSTFQQNISSESVSIKTLLSTREFMFSFSTVADGTTPTKEIYNPSVFSSDESYSTTAEKMKTTCCETTRPGEITETLKSTESSDLNTQEKESTTITTTPEGTQNQHTTFSVYPTTIEITTETGDQTTKLEEITTTTTTTTSTQPTTTSTTLHPLLVTIFARNTWYPDYPSFKCEVPLLPQLTKVSIRQTLKPNCDALEECVQSLTQMMKNKYGNAVNLNYNFIIGGDGNIFEVRGWECRTDPLTSSFTLGADELVIGLTGSVKNNDISDLQINTLRKFLYECSQQGYLSKFSSYFTLMSFYKQTVFCSCPFPQDSPDSCKTCVLAIL